MPAEPGVSCGACRFFQPRPADWRPMDRGYVTQQAAGVMFGTCCRNPPAPDPEDRVIGDWPGTSAGRWCGAFEPAAPAEVDSVLAAVARRILAGDTSGAMPLVDRLIELGLRS